MLRQRIESHMQEKYGTPPEHLWERWPDYAVFRHPASRKWYAAVLRAPARALNLAEGRDVEILNLKCGPILLGSLLAEPGFFPAWHMSKTNWVTVLLDGTVPEEKLFTLIELSYDSVTPKRPRRAKPPETEQQ